MKFLPVLGFAVLAFAACKQNVETKTTTAEHSPLNGTWKLVSSKSITKDTVDTSPKKDIETIKIFNDTSFAFFTHDLKQGKTKPPLYDSGAGLYTLSGENYTEKLKYCLEREWENHDFNFTMKVSKDTITQRGVEKIDSLHIDHIIIETYVRLK